MKKEFIELTNEIDILLDDYLTNLDEKKYLEFINSNDDLKLYDTLMKCEDYSKLTEELLHNVLNFLKK